ncbi:class I glutamine amidotransferase-like protein [Phyllosticta citricarpa]|uniref:Class I glutamine amidotransferase-like protein n=1 Tax=Phyllosticta citricarpa TaxID=55181 RepID=A0ABR1MS42_9PEZI
MSVDRRTRREWETFSPFYRWAPLQPCKGAWQGQGEIAGIEREYENGTGWCFCFESEMLKLYSLNSQSRKASVPLTRLQTSFLQSRTRNLPTHPPPPRPHPQAEQMPGPTTNGSGAGPRIAILKNTPSALATVPTSSDSFITAFSAVAPDAQLDFYDPVEAQEYPADAGAAYDLVILSGGTADINAPDQWVLKMLEFVRELVRARAEGRTAAKVVGICWGHQAVHVALGGRMEMMGESGPEMGVTTIGLTDEGSKFFDFAAGKKSYDIHEFHKRQIVDPAPGFVPLAQQNQCFVSNDNAILTFQGHPEMSAKLAQSLLANASTYTQAMSDDEQRNVATRMEKEHDGNAILSRVVRWVYEK